MCPCAGNAIGDEGARTLAETLAPRQNPDEQWVFNGALNTLDLGCELTATKPLACVACGWSSLHSPCPCADNEIGPEGARALTEALAPQQNPDGQWVFNGALNTLKLGGEYPSYPWLLL